mgnify:CR=1 FL=1
MKKLDLYIGIKFLKAFVLGLLAFLIIFILSSLFKVVGYIIDGKLSTYNGMVYLLSGIPDVLVNVVPLAVLLGGLMAINKMAASSEVIALKTSGISFLRIVTVPIVLSLIISVAVLWFNNEIVPPSNKLKREIKYTKIYDVKEAKIKTSIYMKGTGDYIYYIGMVNGSAETLSNIMVLMMSHDFKKIDKILIGERGEYNSKNKKWTLYNVVIDDIVNGQEKKLKSYIPDFIAENPEEFMRDKVRENEMPASQLKENIKFLNKTGGDTKKMLVALYKRTAYPFAGLIMSLIGLSLGSRYVRGASAISIGLSVVIGYTYYVVNATIEAFSLGGFVNPIIGAWIPNILFLAVGIYTMRNSEY